MSFEALKTYLASLTSVRREQACMPPLAAPVRDWLIVLSSALLVFLACIFFALYVYASAGLVEAPSPSMNSAPSINPALFSKVLEQARLRTEERAQMRGR